MNSLYIAIDFDNTVVLDNYPSSGLSLGSEKCLKFLVSNGHKLILNTCRLPLFKDFLNNPISLNPLQEAIDWFSSNDIPLFGTNCNPDYPVSFSGPRKPYADIYIDDHSLNIPLITINNVSAVDWCVVAKLLCGKGLISIPQLAESVEYTLSNINLIKNSVGTR